MRTNASRSAVFLGLTCARWNLPQKRHCISTYHCKFANIFRFITRSTRIVAGIPDGIDVDLSIVKLPAGALMFPDVPSPGRDIDLGRHRNPRNFIKEFARKADLLGFGRTRFHDLRGIHATALLDAGIPVHTVAQRIGDDPAVLLRNYAKRKRSNKANESIASAISAFSAGFLNG